MKGVMNGAVSNGLERAGEYGGIVGTLITDILEVEILREWCARGGAVTEGGSTLGDSGNGDETRTPEGVTGEGALSANGGPRIG